MGLFDFLKRLIGGGSNPQWCPACGERYAWDGTACPNCGFAGTRDDAQPSPPRQPARGRQSTPAPKRLSGLDAERFQGMSMQQAESEVDQTANFQSAYLDPMNVIPDENLPRIRIIDSTMVGLGLISPEDLAHIHEVGREMNDLRGTYASFARQAQEEVDRSKEGRNRLRERKKREAAERRAQRQREIAERRASDIIFLGRGVSKGLADRRSNVEKLAANELPILATPADVAKALSLTIGQLRWLAFHSEAARITHYVTFTVPKKSGGLRQLASPQPHLAAAQQWVLRNVLQPLPLHDAAHGFVTGRSTVTNATPHTGKQTVVNVDLSDFFPSISFYRTKGVFQSMGYSPAVATILGLLCTECPRQELQYEGTTYHAASGPRGLPQGACTSPALSNLTARRLDARLTGIATKLGWNYTRYADDMTFSSDNTEGIGYLLARIRHICQDESFAVNEKKTRILRRNTAQTVTGVVVNDRPTAGRKLVRRLRSILHRAQFEGLEHQNREGHPYFESWLQGMLAYVHMVNPDQAKPLYEAYNRLGR